MRLLLFLPCRTGQPAGLPDCSGEALRWLYTTEKWCYRPTLVSPFSVTQLTVSRVLTCRPGYSAAHNTQPVSPACRRAVGSTPASSPWGGGRRAGAPAAAGPAPASGRPGHPQPEQALQCHPGITYPTFLSQSWHLADCSCMICLSRERAMVPATAVYTWPAAQYTVTSRTVETSIDRETQSSSAVQS